MLGYARPDPFVGFSWECSNLSLYIAGHKDGELVFPDTVDAQIKHYSTLPYLLGEETTKVAGLAQTPTVQMEAAFYGNDIFFHEIGHITADLLGIFPEPSPKSGVAKWFQNIVQGVSALFGRAPKFDFEYLLEHPLMKNLFFPHYTPETVAKIKEKWPEILSKICSIPNFEVGLKELIYPDSDLGRQFWPSYTRIFQDVPKDKNFIPTIIDRMAKDEKFLSLFQTICVYGFCYLAPWETLGEILQIAGLAYYTNYKQPLLLVNPWSDINLWIAWEQYKNLNHTSFIGPIGSLLLMFFPTSSIGAPHPNM